jgi:hypothetical protein
MGSSDLLLLLLLLHFVLCAGICAPTFLVS